MHSILKPGWQFAVSQSRSGLNNTNWVYSSIQQPRTQSLRGNQSMSQWAMVQRLYRMSTKDLVCCFKWIYYRDLQSCDFRFQVTTLSLIHFSQCKAYLVLQGRTYTQTTEFNRFNTDQVSFTWNENQNWTGAIIWTYCRVSGVRPVNRFVF